MAEPGERVITTDELSGVQARERLHPTLPMRPGQVERREFEYVRHGTATFLRSRDVATGQVIAPVAGRMRTELDFAAPVRGVVATAPEVPRWHFVADNLDIHLPETRVRWVAEVSGLEIDLGTKGKTGVLKDRASRRTFLGDRSHSVVFPYTPKHSSWMNPMEIWLSILTRKVLRWGGFASVEHLHERVLAFIEYYKRTMVKPFQWT